MVASTKPCIRKSQGHVFCSLWSSAAPSRVMLTEKQLKMDTLLKYGLHGIYDSLRNSKESDVFCLLEVLALSWVWCVRDVAVHHQKHATFLLATIASTSPLYFVNIHTQDFKHLFSSLRLFMIAKKCLVLFFSSLKTGGGPGTPKKTPIWRRVVT